jgi:cysteine desulfurase
MARIYMDNAATTMVDPRVVEDMIPLLTQYYGNPSSLHASGQEAREAVQDARAKIGSFIGAAPAEIVFTASGTEANNLALKGAALANRKRGNHLIVSSIEHDCILGSCKWLEGQGFRVTYLPVDGDGLVDPEEVRKAIRHDTLTVSVMQANNEIGTIEPIRAIGLMCRERGVLFHTDACQSFGKIPLNVQDDCLDLATLNAHKIYGPKGVGALYVRSGVSIEPLQHGGGQERGLRSATENVPGIVGFARAAELCFESMGDESTRLAGFRDRIIDEAMDAIPIAYLNGHRVKRLANNVNLGFDGFENDAIRLLLLLNEKGFCVSTGSACSSNSAEPSHVLRAIGLNPLQARGSLRISLGRFTMEEDVQSLLDSLPRAVGSLRGISPLNDRRYST